MSSQKNYIRHSSYDALHKTQASSQYRPTPADIHAGNPEHKHTREIGALVYTLLRIHFRSPWPTNFNFSDLLTGCSPRGWTKHNTH